jgi:hypothetical protein
MQPIQGTVDYGISEQLADLFKGSEDNTLAWRGDCASRCFATSERPDAVLTWTADRITGDQFKAGSGSHAPPDGSWKRGGHGRALFDF